MHHTATHKPKKSLKDGGSSAKSGGTNTQNAQVPTDVVTQAALAEAIKLYMSTTEDKPAAATGATDGASALLKLQGATYETPLSGYICRPIAEAHSCPSDDSSYYDAYNPPSTVSSKDIGGQGY